MVRIEKDIVKIPSTMYYGVLPQGYEIVSYSPKNDLDTMENIIFMRPYGNPEVLLVFRSPEERRRLPERMNLNSRRLEVFPSIREERRLRLLSLQSNKISSIRNLENLPSLQFLDLYNNRITSLDGSLSNLRDLKVLIAGHNRIGKISNLDNCRQLDVLDLHSNAIQEIEGLDNLKELRVLNLGDNRILMVEGLSSLASLTELNLRRNFIEHISGLQCLPMLQRVFLSNNLISALSDVHCLFQIRFLVELTLDGNPVSSKDPVTYRNAVIMGVPTLQYLDSRDVLQEEKDRIRDIAGNSQDFDGLSTPDSSPSRTVSVVTPEEKELMKMRAKLLATFR